ncbi:MAG: hypothetical protein CMI54_03620 [Parcubacteria group bacterium]|nr:hypothetical protein [Parcubacteria group bacterium]|tara:strand:- start:9259 stop:10359 length:1101 start_codon:yes stop_codon:yes gene_type:complete
MIPLARPTLAKLSSLNKKLRDVLETGMITESKYVKSFERMAARFLGVKHVIATSSGTNALLLVLKSLNLKGEVLLPSFTFTSDGHVLLWNRLYPVFVDIDPRTFNMDPDLVEGKIRKKTSAIMPTHVFGNPCDIDKIQKIAKRHSLKVIYDGAHAFGALYKGKPISQFGDATIFSLTPTKVLTTAEGGLVATNNDRLASKLRLAKHNGDSFKRGEEFLGLSARMSEFHAILGIENLKIFKKANKRRLKIVRLYKKLLFQVPGISFQEVYPKNLSVYKDFAIVINKDQFGLSRDGLLRRMLKAGIQTKVYFDSPLHKKRVYRAYKNLNLPNTNFISKNIMDLPLYSHIPIKDVIFICNFIKKAHKLA